MNPESLLLPTLVASLAVGVFSIFARRQKGNRSSWPTWLIIPLLVLFAIVSAIQTVPETPRPLSLLNFGIIWFILLRWTIALIISEKGWGWIFYLLLPLIAYEILDLIESIFQKK